MVNDTIFVFRRRAVHYKNVKKVWISLLILYEFGNERQEKKLQIKYVSMTLKCNINM